MVFLTITVESRRKGGRGLNNKSMSRLPPRLRDSALFGQRNNLLLVVAYSQQHGFLLNQTKYQLKPKLSANAESQVFG